MLFSRASAGQTTAPDAELFAIRLRIKALLVIRRECGQTLARVRVSRTYISIIIISLQRMESM